MEALELMLDLAAGDYAVEESDGQIVASFRDTDGNALGSRLIHSQKAMAAARWTAERKLRASLS